MTSEYWPYGRREYGPDYDEDGFAKGVAPDDPNRLLVMLMNRMAGVPEQIKIRKDYTQQFVAFARLPVQISDMCVVTHDPAQHEGNVPFEVSYDFHGVKYCTVVTLSRGIYHDQHTLDDAITLLFKKLINDIYRATELARKDE